MSRKALWSLILVFVIAAAIRIGTISREDPEPDELFSRRVAMLPMQSALTAIEIDLVHPPLYYLILKAGINIWGSSIIGIRVLSLLFGLATVVLAAFIGNSLLGSMNAGLLAAAILAVNQSMVYYSQEARSYAIYAFLVFLLIVWIAKAAEVSKRHQPLFFASGCVLMVVLLYTHYMGALYIGSVIAAIMICNFPLRTKILALLAAVLAALSFIPWIFSVAGSYKTKHGLNQNLGWVTTPHLGDLTHVWASAIGLPSIRGGATICFLFVVSLSVVALTVRPNDKEIRIPPAAIALVMFSILPPIALFILSQNPIHLPIFVARHLLPSIAALCVLCCYGLENLARRFSKSYALIFAAGSLMLVVAAAVPTFTAYAYGPNRYPFHIIAKDLETQSKAGWKVYTKDFYMIGEPINIFCSPQCVLPLPKDYLQLPKTFIILYQPRLPVGVQDFQKLIGQSFEVQSSTDYPGGLKSPFETTLVHLARKEEK